jgi:hypothetical protein
MLDVRLDDVQGGPELSDDVSDLLVEAEHFHHWGDEWGPDRSELRRLAFAILTDTRPA